MDSLIRRRATRTRAQVAASSRPGRRAEKAAPPYRHNLATGRAHHPVCLRVRRPCAESLGPRVAELP